MQTLSYAAALISALAVVVLLSVADAGAAESLDAARVTELAPTLPENPVGLGRPAADRAAWEKRAAEPAFQRLIPRAADLLAKPLPEQSDELFLDFSRTGNRTRWQNVAFERRGRLTTLVLAECLENKGRFLPAIEQLVQALCAERTWVMPAHDARLDNFHGKSIDIDLASSALGWNLATVDWLVGDRLAPATRQLLRDNLQQRVIGPYRAMITGAHPPNWWMLGYSNWNAVCLAGVTGTGLAEVASREGRAELVAAAEKYSRFFLSGFTPDGYCSEGLGYWDYGFGHFVLLAETVRQATGGKVDLLARQEAKMPAMFGARIQIIGGVAPAFADCGVNAQPAASIMFFVNRVLGLGLREYDELNPADAFGTLFEAALYNFPNAATEKAPAAAASAGPGLRTWFDSAGILISRPAAGSPCRFGVALKGGHNAELHNHNDVGSYVVVIGERAVLLDPGAETYTARTFSAHRYDSKLLNSFGHPVPVVAGKLQKEGRDAHAVVLQTDFTDETDTLKLDIRSAYPCPELKALERTFAYSRAKAGSLTVSDRVEFTSAQAFGTALITRGSCRKLEDGSVEILDAEEAVRAVIDTGGAAYTVDTEQINEDAPVHPTRIGINLASPVTSATITVKITPLDLPDEGAKGSLLRNGGFERGAWCWDIPADGLASISEERAASGKSSLKISDHDKARGSNIASARIPVAGAGAYELSGKFFPVSGSGIGMYVKLFDARRNLLNPADAHGNIAPVGTLNAPAGKWQPFGFKFQVPAGTSAMQLWIHSFNSSEVEGFIDDLAVKRVD